jgi:hypothetical protein
MSITWYSISVNKWCQAMVVCDNLAVGANCIKFTTHCLQLKRLRKICYLYIQILRLHFLLHSTPFLFIYYRLILYWQEHFKKRGCIHDLWVNTLFLSVKTQYHFELRKDSDHVRLTGAFQCSHVDHTDGWTDWHFNAVGVSAQMCLSLKMHCF